MKNILKIFAVLFAVVTLFSLASCGGKDNEKDSFETNGTSSVTETEKEETEGEPTTEKDGNADSGKTETGGNTSGEQQSGGKSEETTSTTEPEDNDNEGEIVIHSGGIVLPVVKP